MAVYLSDYVDHHKMQLCVKELFESVKSGNVEAVQELIEDYDLDVNMRDRWDSTPLYYACLCGHQNVVEYLLQKGAQCQENTFDGERCFYAALTGKIKATLRNYKTVTSDSMRRDGYVQFLKSTYEARAFKDFCFIVHGVHILINRVVLAARSAYFAQMFQTKWRTKASVNISHPLVTWKALEYMIRYLYTDRMEIPLDEVASLRLLCKQCRLTKLQRKLDDAERSYHCYVDTKAGRAFQNVSVICIQPKTGSREINDSFGFLAQYVIPAEIRHLQFPLCASPIFRMDLPEMNQEEVSRWHLVSCSDAPYFADLCIVVEEHRFYGHKLFFCGRSDYFSALIDFYSVSRQDADGEVLEITLQDVSAEVFAIVVVYIYSNDAIITSDNILDVLHFSTVYLLPGLKKLCCNFLADKTDVSSVVQVLQLARLYDSAMLEGHCAEFMARHLCKIINQPDFARLIIEDASAISNRQETDSIPIVDDIRYHLHRFELPGAGLKESECENMTASAKLHLLGDLIERLGLEG